jgi:hypothetical protein
LARVGEKLNQNRFLSKLFFYLTYDINEHCAFLYRSHTAGERDNKEAHRNRYHEICGREEMFID